jgi:hypothetical protein
LDSKKENNASLFTGLKKYLRRLTDLQILQQRRLLTFLFFLVISTVFWFVRSLGEEYEEDLSYPVRYENFPENKILTGSVPDKLHLRVRARGFTLLRSKLNLSLVPLKFNVSSYALNTTGSDTFYVVTETVRDLLSAEIPQLKILDISPDTLIFSFTDIVLKKVPVKPILALHDEFFQKQYMQNGSIIVIPDSVTVSGPGNLVRNILYAPTLPIRQTNLTDTIILQCELQPFDRVSYSVDQVQITLPVDRFTEVDENLAVLPVNVPESLNMIAIPGQVTITFNICLSNYNKMVKNPPVPKIDYNAIRDEQVTRLTVFLSDTPEIISNVRFNPKETEFLVTRK